MARPHRWEYEEPDTLETILQMTHNKIVKGASLNLTPEE